MLSSQLHRAYNAYMFIMYVDDSGDPGKNVAVTKHFILTALVIHELRWNEFLEDLVTFRKHLRDTKNLKLRHEIHAVDFLSRKSQTGFIPRNDRLDILKQCLDWMASRPDVSIYSVCIDKSKHLTEDIYELAWRCLTQRFENTISYKNFPGPANADDRGMIISDRSDEKKLRGIIRKMRRHNPISNRPQFGAGYRNLQLKYIIEDPNFRDSDDSYFLQMVDVASYFLTQKHTPNKYVKAKGARNYFDRLTPVLNTKVSQTKTGVVEL